MIEVMTDVPAGIFAVRSVGTLTKEDYDSVVVPLLEEATRTGHRIRCLCQVGPEFRGLTSSGAWEDVRLGLRALRLFEACAVVSDLGWIRQSSRLAAFFMPCPVQVFGEHEREQAIKWLSSMPERPGIEHRLIPESGVVVVEVSQPLRAPDFDALGLTVDSWLDTHERRARPRVPGLGEHRRSRPAHPVRPRPPPKDPPGRGRGGGTDGRAGSQAGRAFRAGRGPRIPRPRTR